MFEWLQQTKTLEMKEDEVDCWLIHTATRRVNVLVIVLFI